MAHTRRPNPAGQLWYPGGVGIGQDAQGRYMAVPLESPVGWDVVTLRSLFPVGFDAMKLGVFDARLGYEHSGQHGYHLFKVRVGGKWSRPMRLGEVFTALPGQRQENPMAWPSEPSGPGWYKAKSRTYYTQKPGGVVEEGRAAAKRLTDWEFIAKLAKTDTQYPGVPKPWQRPDFKVEKKKGKKKNPPLRGVRSAGSNMTEVQHGDLRVLYSYGTPVAVLAPSGLYKTAHFHSRTTSKHIGAWFRAQGLDPRGAQELTQEGLASAVERGLDPAQLADEAFPINLNPTPAEMREVVKRLTRRKRNPPGGVWANRTSTVPSLFLVDMEPERAVDLRATGNLYVPQLAPDPTFVPSFRNRRGQTFIRTMGSDGRLVWYRVEWRKRNPYGPRARYRHRRVRSPRQFTRGSFRTVAVGRGTKVVVGKRRGERRRTAAGRTVQTVQAILTPKGQARKLSHRNPPEQVPAGTYLGRVERIEYVHAFDGKPYFHDFHPLAYMVVQPDGNVVLYHPRNRLWKPFAVPAKDVR